MKKNLETLLLLRGLAPTREKARAIIAMGRVLVNGRPADKAGVLFPEESAIEVKGTESPYVSRGGLKLAAGLDAFAIDPAGLVCADIGASTGGFTDCLLQRGATRVYAVDVGYGQLAWKLRTDPRVVVMERTNARNLKAGDIPEPLDLAVIDASFISLRLLLPPLLAFFPGPARVIALIKPQFEADRNEVGEGGVVRDELLHREIIEKIQEAAAALGFRTAGICPSPLLGAKGNREFLIHLVSNPLNP